MSEDIRTFPDGSNGEIPMKPRSRTENFLGRIADNPYSKKRTPRTRKERMYNEIFKAVEEIGTNLAPDYNKTATYEIGDYCRHDGVFYVCSTPISTAEEWNSEHWTQTTITEALAIASRDFDTNAVHYSAEEKTDAAKANARQNIGAEPEKFIVTVTGNTLDCSADKTFAEISAAYLAGKIVVARFDTGQELSISTVSDDETEISFSMLEASSNNSEVWGLRFIDDGTLELVHHVYPKPEGSIRVTDSAAVITPVARKNYKCGELTSLTISNPPATGSYSIVFYSGSTATTVTGIDNFTPEANKRYRIDVQDGYATFASWPYTPTP